MSILTKEQADAVWRARVGVKCEVGKQWTPAADINALLSIIDDLQARAPKQYTEQELREWFENRPLVQDEIDALLHEVVPGENEAWYSVLIFAAHVGALKAES